VKVSAKPIAIEATGLEMQRRCGGVHRLPNAARDEPGEVDAGDRNSGPPPVSLPPGECPPLSLRDK
jgi:hypothetical protein